MAAGTTAWVMMTALHVGLLVTVARKKSILATSVGTKDSGEALLRNARSVKNVRGGSDVDDDSDDDEFGLAIGKIYEGNQPRSSPLLWM